MRSRPRGLSLGETVVAIFVFVVGALAVMNLYTAALRYGARAQEETLAVGLAQSKMDELRSWARRKTSPGHNWDDWSSHTAGPTTHPDYPGFQMQVFVQPVQLTNPSTEFEAPFAPDQLVVSSCRRVTVAVTWAGGREFRLTSVISQPSLSWGSPSLVITPVGGLPDPIPVDQDVTFRAEAFDSDGRAIPDQRFRWYLIPGTGNGILTQDRDGQEAVFDNRIRRLDGKHEATGGQATLRVVSYLGGVERREEVTLNLTASLAPW